MGNHPSYSHVPSPTSHAVDLRHRYDEDNTSIKVEEYKCSHYFAAYHLLLSGEWGNPDKESRKAVLTATDIRDGTVTGELVIDMPRLSQVFAEWLDCLPASAVFILFVFTATWTRWRIYQVFDSQPKSSRRTLTIFIRSNKSSTKTIYWYSSPEAVTSLAFTH